MEHFQETSNVGFTGFASDLRRLLRQNQPRHGATIAERQNTNAAASVIKDPVGRSSNNVERMTPETVANIPMKAEMQVILTNRSVQNRAAAAGMTKSEVIRTTPTDGRPATTTRPTRSMSSRSSDPVGHPVA